VLDPQRNSSFLFLFRTSFDIAPPFRLTTKKAGFIFPNAQLRIWICGAAFTEVSYRL